MAASSCALPRADRVRMGTDRLASDDSWLVHLWQDHNQDGISQAGEMQTLQEAGIASVKLASTKTDTSYGDAQLVQSGSFTRADGTEGQAGSFIKRRVVAQRGKADARELVGQREWPQQHVVARAFGIKGKAFLFELELAAFGSKHIVLAQEVSKYPANRRDLAIVVKSDVRFSDILATIRKVGGNQLVDLKLFDVYTGQGIADGMKSLAIALTLQDKARTLEDKDIQQVISSVVQALGEEFNATLRD